MFKNIGKRLQKVSTVVFEIFVIVEVFYTLYTVFDANAGLVANTNVCSRTNFLGVAGLGFCVRRR